MAENSILKSREITLRFGGLEALNRLSFSVLPHHIVAIIGPNGAGKTTLLNASPGSIPRMKGIFSFREPRSLAYGPFKSPNLESIGRFSRSSSLPTFPFGKTSWSACIP